MVRFLFLALFACAGCKDRHINDQGSQPQRNAVDHKMDAAMPPVGQPHTIRISALKPWTSIAKPVLDDKYSTGDRMSAQHDVFKVGGFRLTFVPAKDSSDPESIGRVEYVFRARTLQDVSGRLVEALQRFGFAVPRTFDDVIARASQIPDDLAGLDIGDRLVSQTFDWAPEWRGFVKIFSEGALTGKDTHRAQWMVELRAFQPGFRAASDP